VTKHFDFPRLHLPSLRRHGHDAVVSRGSLEFGAAGAVAFGALAIGAIAIGAIAINRLVVRRARLDRLSIGTLDIDRLVVHEREGQDEDAVDNMPSAGAATG
jgi:hypothetical protein